jgi:hypothetical protein
MKNLIVVLAILFSITLVNQEMFSQKREHRDGKDFRMDMKERLNLTDQQEDKIESLRIAHQEKMIKFKADLDLKELEIRKIKSSDKISRGEMIRIEKEMNAIKNEMALERVNHQMDVYDNLDANQRKTWLEKPEKFGCKMHCKMCNRR